MLITLNAFLLSTFATNIDFGTDTKSSLRRYQILSIIYTNLCFLLIILGYEITVIFFLQIADFIVYTPVNIPFVLLSFFFLKKGQDELAAGTLLVQIHFINFLSGTYYEMPLVALFLLMLLPHISSLLYLSPNMRLANLLFCSFQGIIFIMKIQRIFLNTDHAQSLQISALSASAVICLVFTNVGITIQRSVQDELWKMAHLDFDKVIKLSKDLEQESENRNIFAKSLTQQVRSPLSFINGRIDFLLEMIKEQQYLPVLRELKLKSESLIYFINNLLDGIDLKSGTLEVTNSETNLIETVKNVFALNLDHMKKTNKFIHMSVDENIPEKLWLDQSRFFQILMKLISNGLEFSEKDSTLYAYAAWCAQNQDKENLLTPIHQISQQRPETKQFGLDGSYGSIKSLRLQKNESSVFKEFTFEEAQNRRKNFQVLNSFQTRGLIDLNNSIDSDSQHEYWRIDKTRSIFTNSKTISASLNKLGNRNRQGIKNQGYLKVQVSDTGMGMSAENINNLFELNANRQYNRQSRNRSVAKGLWICQQLCQKMGGDLKVYSQVNEGTTFVFYIPVISNPRILSLPNPHKPARNTLSALVVDDYPFNRDLHQLFLEKEGVDVTLASNGKEALDIYMAKGEDAFDFIMMDIQMPVMDGLTAAQEIRAYEAEEGLRKVDIYFVSGEYIHEEDVLRKFRVKDETKKADGIKCLKKPINFEIVSGIAKKYQRVPRRGQTIQNIEFKDRGKRMENVERKKLD